MHSPLERRTASILSALLVTPAAWLLGAMPAADPGDANAALLAEAGAVFGLQGGEIVDVRLAGDATQGALAVWTGANGVVQLDLAPIDVLAPGFRLLEDLGDGVLVEIDHPAPPTVRGRLSGDPTSDVRGALLEDGLYARLHSADGEDVWIQPLLGHVSGALPGQHVVYRLSDIQPGAGTCGTDLLANSPEIPSQSGNTHAGTSTPFVAELACDTDFEYFQDYGSTTSVMNRITSVINTMNLQYENEVGITHVITTIIVRSTSSDPYTTSDSSVLLSQFQSEWNTNQTSIQRDVAQLFTGRNLMGSVIGIAFVSTVCSVTQAYSLVESDFNGSFACVTDLSAHELGHTWSADHCTCPSNTMNPFITCANNFHDTFTVPGIIAFRDNRLCLTGGPDPYSDFDGAPRSGDAPLAVVFTDVSKGTSLSGWSWNFGDGSTSTLQNPTHVFTVPGTYDVSLTVTGVNGSDSRTNVDYVKVSAPVLATCTSRNPSLVNPNALLCGTNPVLGTNWTSTIDAAVGGVTGGISVLFAYEDPFSPIPTSFGDILVDPFSPFVGSHLAVVAGGSATHSFAIPNDTSLTGFTFSSQAFLNQNGRLTNALDLKIGK